MANFVYNAARNAYADGTLHWEDDTPFTLLLVMTNSDLDDPTHVNLGAAGTLDEFDGVGYSRLTLSNPVIAPDGAVVDFETGTVSFASLGSGTRNIKGAAVMRESDDLLVLWIDNGFPIDPADRGINFTLPLWRLA